jgi:hypothetical protein
MTIRTAIVTAALAVLVTRRSRGRPVYDAPRVLTQDVTVPPQGEVTLDFELT